LGKQLEKKTERTEEKSGGDIGKKSKERSEKLNDAGRFFRKLE
jgi:hypothetical protein